MTFIRSAIPAIVSVSAIALVSATTPATPSLTSPDPGVSAGAQCATHDLGGETYEDPCQPDIDPSVRDELVETGLESWIAACEKALSEAD